jgi:hypothetical protein
VSSGLIIPGRDREAVGRIGRRMEGMAQAAGAGEIQLERDPWQPRWTLDARWVVFECGCRCERVKRLAVEHLPGDAVIFRGLPEQAVYDHVCHRHGAGMNKIVRFSGYSDFAQWKRTRKHLLMGVAA